MPKGQAEIAFDPIQAVYQEIYDPNGKKMPMEKRNERLIIVKVPTSEQGKMWSFRLGKNLRNIEMLNIPPLYGLSKQFELGGRK